MQRYIYIGSALVQEWRDGGHPRYCFRSICLAWDSDWTIFFACACICLVFASERSLPLSYTSP